jgi:hypothetical protein
MFKFLLDYKKVINIKVYFLSFYNKSKKLFKKKERKKLSFYFKSFKYLDPLKVLEGTKSYKKIIIIRFMGKSCKNIFILNHKFTLYK